MKYYGRRKPYTEQGIKRIPCSRCGKPSQYQWQACANNRYYMTMCKNCDIKVNELVLKFLKIPNYKILIQKYKNNLI